MPSSSLQCLLLPLTVVLVAQFFLLQVLAQMPAMSPSPAPSASNKLNLTALLQKGGEFTTLSSLLNSTGLTTKLENVLSNTSTEVTLLAPTDTAFSNLKTGYLSGLSAEQQSVLLQYHVIPEFYTLNDLTQVSNPVKTLASGQLNGSFFLNFTATTNQVNVSTGVVQTRVGNSLYSTPPLSAFSINVVLQPIEFSGNHTAPAPSTAPSAAASSPGVNKTASSTSTPPPVSAAHGKQTAWWLMTGTGILYAVALI